jgi:hypothetical protein
MKGHGLNQQSRQEVRGTHTVFNSDMVVRGKVERLKGQEVDLIYLRRPRRTNGAARCCEGMRGTIDTILLRILTFEPHQDRSYYLGICPVESISRIRSAPYMPGGAAPALLSAPISHAVDKMRREGNSHSKPPCKWTLPDTDVSEPHSGGVLQNACVDLAVMLI